MPVEAVNSVSWNCNIIVSDASVVPLNDLLNGNHILTLKCWQRSTLTDLVKGSQKQSLITNSKHSKWKWQKFTQRKTEWNSVGIYQCITLTRGGMANFLRDKECISVSGYTDCSDLQQEWNLKLSTNHTMGSCKILFLKILGSIFII